MPEDSRKLDQIVESIHSIEVMQARMDGKLDVLTNTSADHESRLRQVEAATSTDADTAQKLTDHESRMRVIERRLWMLAGAAAAVGSAGGSVVSQILK